MLAAAKSPPTRSRSPRGRLPSNATDQSVDTAALKELASWSTSPDEETATWCVRGNDCARVLGE
jgi:hypothetical protein